MNEIAEALEWYCDSQPYSLIDKPKFDYRGVDSTLLNDIQFIDTAKEYPQKFIIGDDAIFSKSFLKKFWINQLKISMRLTNKDDLLDFVLRGRTSFSFGYNATHPSNFKIEDVYLFNFMPDNTDVYKNPENLAIASFLVEELKIFSDSGYFVNEDLEIEETFPRQRLIFGIIFHMLTDGDKKMELGLLTHVINTGPYSYVKKKPILFSTFAAEIELNRQYFNEQRNIGVSIPGYEGYGLTENDLISLNDFLKEYKEKLKNQRFSYDAILKNNSEIHSGIVSCSINSIDFPIAETREYLKIRDYLKIFRTNDFVKEFNNLFSVESIKDPKSLFNNLVAVYYNMEEFPALNKESIDNFSEFIKKKIKFSFIPMKEPECFEFTTYLNIELAPIFNLETHVGNLFRYIMEEKFNKFKGVLSKVKLEDLR